MPDSQECQLTRTLDRHERCPGDACPFWDSGHCQLDDLRPDLDTNPELAGFLLDLRSRLMPDDSWRPLRRVGMPERD